MLWLLELQHSGRIKYTPKLAKKMGRRASQVMLSRNPPQ